MTKKKIRELLKCDIFELIKESRKIYLEKCQNKFEICSIVNAKSGRCSEDCKFCAQSGHYKTAAQSFDLISENEVLKCAEIAEKNKAERFGIVTSGRGLNDKQILKISKMLEKINIEKNIKPCASLGELTEKQLLILKESGLTRFHHNIETSEKFYSNIVTTHSFKDRIAMIERLKKIGFEVCSGGIIGLGESIEDRIEMALTLKKLEVDAVPINILMPIKGTPLENVKRISVFEIIKTIALFRIILEDKMIKLAAGRETLGDFQGLSFLAGANGFIIGGYLTIAGRSVEDDWKLLENLTKFF